MNEMIKRRKDEGFTLIELMIVIAVIGILAVVLVPRVGSIKDTAKSSGVDVNVRIVAANVQSRIMSWEATKAAPSAIQTELDTTFSNTDNNLTNPISGLETVYDGTGTAAKTDALQIYTDTDTLSDKPEGGVVVTIADTSNIVTGVTISGYDANGSLTTEVVIKP